MPTSAKKPLVIVTRKLPEAVETRMRELFDARLNVDDKQMTHAELVDAVKTAHVLVPTVTDRIDRSLLSQAGPQLKLIANFGNGVDNIDLDTARVRGIIVTNTPGVLTEDTADMTMALILAVPRRLAEGTALLKDSTEALAGLVAHLDARPQDLGQAARHHRHGPHRPGRGATRQGFRVADSLLQPAPRLRGHRAGAGGHLLGQPRPDAGAHGYRLGQLPAHACHLSPAVSAAAEAPEAHAPTSSTPRAAR